MPGDTEAVAHKHAHIHTRTDTNALCTHTHTDAIKQTYALALMRAGPPCTLCSPTPPADTAAAFFPRWGRAAAGSVRSLSAKQCCPVLSAAGAARWGLLWPAPA